MSKTRYVTVTNQYVSIQRRDSSGKIYWNEYWKITGKYRKRLAVVLSNYTPMTHKHSNGDTSKSKLYSV